MAVQRKCYDSSACGSGYACIGNECVPQFNADGFAPGTTAGSGSGACNGGEGGCSKPGCENPNDPPGPDPDNPPPGGPCNKWCDNYFKATGEKGPGCGSNSDCGKCEVCDALGTEVGTCTPANIRCDCPGGGCDDCEKCDQDGTCQSADDTCLKCCNHMNHICPCGKIVSCQMCSKGDDLSVAQKCYNCTKDLCDKACPPLPDEPCDCNCHNDCPDCQLCGADGKCYRDPSCFYGQWVFNGTQNNPVREVSTSFRNGVLGDPNAPPATPGCEDGNCYPVPVGAPDGLGGVFQPIGPQEAWGGSVVVNNIGDCSGRTFGCGLDLYNDGEFVSSLLSATYANCPDTAPPQEVGCYLTGSWEFVPDP